MNLPWKKALREIYGGRNYADRIGRFRAVWRWQHKRMEARDGVALPDSMEVMIALWEREGIPEYWVGRLKKDYAAWRVERDREQRRAAAMERWHPKTKKRKKVLGARLKRRK